jgi:two-component sensor histidine kinase
MSDSYQSDKKVMIEEKIEDMDMDARKLNYIGILINEIVSNSFKYAFNQTANQPAKIIIEFFRMDRQFHLILRDNGPGISDFHQIYAGKKGFGMLLIHSLVMQLDATLHYETQQGAFFELTFS